MKRLQLSALIIALGLVATATAVAQNRSVPEPGEARPFNLPDAREMTLSNGLSVTVVDRPGFPTISLRLSVRAGRDTRFENPAVPTLTARLLRDGLADRSAEDVANAIDREGIDYSHSVTANRVLLSTDGLSSQTSQMLDLIGQLVTQATFPAERVAARRAEYLGELQLQTAQPAFHRRRMTWRALFGSHPYANLFPTIEQVESVNRDAIVAFYLDNYVPARAHLVVVGDVPDDIGQQLEAAFAHWVRWGRAYTAPEPATVRGCNRAHVVLRPDSAQTSIIYFGPAPPIDDPDYFSALVANQVLGGGASARLFMNLREDKSYTYGAYSGLQQLQGASFFYAQSDVRSDVTGAALEEFRNEFDRFAQVPIAENEFAGATNYLSGVFPIQLERNSSLAGRLSELIDRGFDASYLRDYRQRVGAVGNEGALEMGRSFIHHPFLDLVMVGEEDVVIDAAKAVANQVDVYDLEGNLLRTEEGSQPAVCGE